MTVEDSFHFCSNYCGNFLIGKKNVACWAFTFDGVWYCKLFLSDVEINSMLALWWLQAALEKAQGQVLKLERESYQKIEPETARKTYGSTIPSGEFTTPMASRQGKDNEDQTDDTIILYSNSLASRSKVEQLKLQVGIQNSDFQAMILRSDRCLQ
jgi:hypothetical protein